MFTKVWITWLGFLVLISVLACEGTETTTNGFEARLQTVLDHIVEADNFTHTTVVEADFSAETSHFLYKVAQDIQYYSWVSEYGTEAVYFVIEAGQHVAYRHDHFEEAWLREVLTEAPRPHDGFLERVIADAAQFDYDDGVYTLKETYFEDYFGETASVEDASYTVVLETHHLTIVIYESSSIGTTQITMTFTDIGTTQIILFDVMNPGEVDTVTVSFETHGGALIPSMNEIAVGTPIILPTPSRRFYTFVGWFLSDGGDEQFITDASPVMEDWTLHARWRIDEDTYYRATYEALLLEHLELWGLGTTVIEYVSNNRDYTWYVDQITTGVHGAVNCGPTSVEMAGRWFDVQFTHTALEARQRFRPAGGWWYDTDIAATLGWFNIPHDMVYVNQESDLMAVLDNGNILLVNNDMFWISFNRNLTERTGRFYVNVTGHYLVVKGYIITDQGTYFEVYDPYSVHHVYEDGTLKGENRYYLSNQFVRSITKWNTKAYTIFSD